MSVKRDYDSSRRRRQAAQTRADILAAAQRLFAERGYAATTIEAIAAQAEVSEATVYAGFGSKRGILLAFQQLMEQNTDLGERRRAFHAAAGNPAEQVAIAVSISLSFPAKHADLIAVLLSARGMDPDIDEFLHRGLVDNHGGAWSMVASELASQHALRPGLSEQEAGDLAAALTRIEIYRILSSERGWSHDRITEMLTTVVRCALLG